MHTLWPCSLGTVLYLIEKRLRFIQMYSILFSPFEKRYYLVFQYEEAQNGRKNIGYHKPINKITSVMSIWTCQKYRKPFLTLSLKNNWLYNLAVPIFLKKKKAPRTTGKLTNLNLRKAIFSQILPISVLQIVKIGLRGDHELNMYGIRYFFEYITLTFTDLKLVF